MGKPISWALIERTCPEFQLNAWDFGFAIVAFIGVVFTCIQTGQIHEKKEEGSSLLATLALCDFLICFLYIMTYFTTSVILYFRSNLFADFRIDTLNSSTSVKILYDTIMTFTVFLLIVERFLWTCSSRTRLTWRIFTDKKLKRRLALVAIVYAFFSFFTRMFVLSDVPFCDIAPRPLLFEIEALKIIQLYVVPGIDAFVCVATLIFALLTILRLSKVGQGEEPVVQEEVNLEDGDAKGANGLNTNLIKRWIICILVVYATFLIRTVCYYIFINPLTSDLFEKTPSARNLTVWWYDFMSVLFSGSRYIVYYAFCRNQIVTEFPPTAIGQ
ncbi:hypothetical protein B9Z55_017509 [Caenorhabditis nigoni]|uniref:G-protein coupled receptors family 1 profile domain-containing protein n=2 Tax=Caenorhabditis nigoni TaxID=1611254 RepID=A0A2G5TAE0_9PELO|nr:hypothetical protein B9Z55_017509 [Caenorhabditis nigoni]